MPTLHNDVKNIAGNKPALVVSTEAFKGLLLNDFIEAVKMTMTVSVPVEGFAEVEVMLAKLSVANKDDFQVILSMVNTEVYATLTPDISADFAIHVAGKPQLEFSRVQLKLNDFKVRLSVMAPNIVLSSPDYDVKGKITPSNSRSAALQDSGIDESALQSIEGSLAYIMPRKIVSSAFNIFK